MEARALGDEAVDGPLVRLAVDAHVRDGVEPDACSWIHGAEVGDLEAIQEVLLDVADARFDAALLVAGSDVAGHDLEAELSGEVGVTRVEDGRLAREPPQHRGLEVVDHDLLGHGAAEVLERAQMAPQEVLHRLRDGELDVHQPAVAQHHHEEAQPPAGVADVDDAVLAPINLSALAGRKREREERGLAWRSNSAQVVFDDREAARVTGFLQPLEDLHAAIRVALDEPSHRRLVLIELAAATRALPRPIALRL